MALAKNILQGDIRAAARLIRRIDDRQPDAVAELKILHRHTGRAFIIGITGPPGVGKSTLTDQLVAAFRQQRQTVGVVAIDPSSSFSGGALLGDRIRMNRHATDDGVFIRSLGTRGHLGGLSGSANDIISVLDAMGKDVILVETVGVGQDEIEICRTAHCTIVVMVPGLGDDIQAIKAGIMEIGDIFVVNKADRPDAERTVRDLQGMVELNHPGIGEWWPPVIKTVALRNEGITDLVEKIEQQQAHFKDNGHWRQVEQHKSEFHFKELLRDQLFNQVYARISAGDRLEQLIQEIAERKMDPYTAVEKIIQEQIKKL